jgi:HK97 family phage major capsid protein
MPPDFRTTEQARARLRVVDGELATVRPEINRLAAIPGNLEPVQSERYWELTSRADALWEEKVAAEDYLAQRSGRIAQLAGVSGGALTLDTGDGAEGAEQGRSRHFGRTGSSGPTLLRYMDDADLYDRSHLLPQREECGPDYRSRALMSIERWPDDVPAEHRESAERLVTHADVSERDRVVGDHLLQYGSPAYRSAWRKYARNPQTAPLRYTPEEAQLMADSDVSARAMSEASSSVGQALVPPFLDPTIILTNAGVSNPLRSICTVKVITTQTWKGVTSAGVTAEWTAEASEMTDASPSFVQPSITPVRADAWLQASMEMLQDTDIASELAMLFADARDRLEGGVAQSAGSASGGFISGSGTTSPFGILTRMSLTTASRVSANTNGQFNAYDVFNVDNQMSQRWRANANWLANKSFWNMARQFATGTGALTGAFWVDFGGGRPASLIGYPVYESSAMISSLSTATASSDYAILLGDFSQYYIIDRVGMSVAFNPMIMGANRRPTGEVGWAAFWRTGGDCVATDAFRCLIC